MIKKTEIPEEEVVINSGEVGTVEDVFKPEVEIPVEVKPKYVMTQAEIDSRYQAHLEKSKRGGK